jgi:hypothetical protein
VPPWSASVQAVVEFSKHPPTFQVTFLQEGQKINPNYLKSSNYVQSKKRNVSSQAQKVLVKKS